MYFFCSWLWYWLWLQRDGYSIGYRLSWLLCVLYTALVWLRRVYTCEHGVMSFPGEWCHFRKMLASWSCRQDAFLLMRHVSAHHLPSLAEKLRLAKLDIHLSTLQTLHSQWAGFSHPFSHISCCCCCWAFFSFTPFNICWLYFIIIAIGQQQFLYRSGVEVAMVKRWIMSDLHVWKWGVQRLKWIVANTKGVSMDGAQCLNENHGTRVIGAQCQWEQQHST